MAEPSKAYDLAIIGAGPAGLTLARILLQGGSKLSIAIFESDESPDSRYQGGALDLRIDSGQIAMKKAGLYEEWKKYIRPSESAMRILDHNGELRYADDGGPPTEDGEFFNPEIDRGDLRRILLESVPESIIHWNHKLQNITWNDSASSFSLEFLNRPSPVVVSKLVGADGAWSRVRSQILSKQTPEYTGLNFVDFHIPQYRTKYPDFRELVGDGLTFALDDTTSLVGHPDGKGDLGMYAVMRCPEEYIKDSPAAKKPTGKEQLKAVGAEWFSSWSPRLTQCFDIASEDNIALRSIHALPTGFKWEHHKACTLIGDAAHVMSPFAGEGVNLAVTDAMELAECMLADKPFSEFELKMWPRVEVAAAESARNLEIFFGKDSLNRTIELFKSYGPPPDV